MSDFDVGIPAPADRVPAGEAAATTAPTDASSTGMPASSAPAGMSVEQALDTLHNVITAGRVREAVEVLAREHERLRENEIAWAKTAHTASRISGERRRRAEAAERDLAVARQERGELSERDHFASMTIRQLEDERDAARQENERLRDHASRLLTENAELRQENPRLTEALREIGHAATGQSLSYRQACEWIERRVRAVLGGEEPAPNEWREIAEAFLDAWWEWEPGDDTEPLDAAASRAMSLRGDVIKLAGGEEPARVHPAWCRVYDRDMLSDCNCEEPALDAEPSRG